MARAIAVEIVGDASSVERAFGKASVSAKKFDRSLSSSVRGATAGAGVFRSFGRSLAFASGGFLAFAGLTSTIRNSIEGAEKLEKAQRGLDVAIRHTGGSLGKLKPQYEAVAEGAAKYGVNQADATVALQRATLLTGNAVKAQHAYQEALVISKATGKDFNTVLTATAKGQAGITTSLRRYGILVDATSTGQEQFNTVMGRFAGQAKANTSAIDRFNATWQNTEEILGTALLPTLNKLLTRFSDWLTKMEQSGKLQKNINEVTREAGHVFHALESVVHAVDKVTGSFLHTLELLAAFKFATMIAGWSGALTGLIAKWRGVTAAAEGAQAAETGAAGAGLKGLLTGATITGAAIAGSAIAEGSQGHPQIKGFRKVGGGGGGTSYIGPNGNFFIRDPAGNLVDTGIRAPGAPSAALQPSRPEPGGARFGGPSRRGGSPVSSAPPHIFRQQFQLTGLEQLAQAQAGLTRGSADDVAAAKQVVARVKRLVAEGRLKGKALIQALGVEASAMSTIWSAEDAAAQKRAQAAARAKARIAAQIQNSIDPLKLEVQLSKDQALGRDTTKDLKALRRAAEKALKSGKLSLEQQKEAWDQIASINQQLADSTTAAVSGFKELNTRQIANKVKGITKKQRKQLRAALSQQGPHHTGPGSGTGAYGYTIGRDGRPIHVHNHVHLDGKEIEHSTTKHRQRRRRRNSSQRRGPNAGG